MNYLIIGPPGCGKGTQSAFIKDAFNIPHLSTGELLRNEISVGSSLGKEIEEIMSRGDFVSDDIMLELVESNLSKCSDGFLLDGFPRTLEQAERLKTRIDRVIFIDLPDDICVSRIMGRGEGRKDDNMDVALHRIKQYKEKTYPVIEYYKKMGKVLTIDGSKGSKEEISKIILEKLK
ncbi:adenylate kinase [Astathelohania contejeani]|uniref:Adenylate kinase n=1 Tax=Astathelohania contejeani TaxID=164912 RepID=A0ABQ7I2H4_9MICR|nr:adenylate kinase [Thelohania contejeani]